MVTRASELHIAVGREAACGISEGRDRSSHSGKAHAASNFVIVGKPLVLALHPLPAGDLAIAR